MYYPYAIILAIGASAAAYTFESEQLVDSYRCMHVSCLNINQLNYDTYQPVLKDLYVDVLEECKLQR